MSDTKIEWTNKVWNPVSGCTKVSQGCKNCYAERVFPRAYSRPDRAGAFRKFTDVRTHPERLDAPLHWREPRRIFVNSMSDLFHEDVPFDFIDSVFAVMAMSQRHTYQILTKRPQRMLDYLTAKGRAYNIGCEEFAIAGANPKLRLQQGDYQGPVHRRLPLANVWLGVSVEDQATADERIPLLLETPAAVRFLSCEPLLGEIRLGKLGENCLTWLPHGNDGDREQLIDWVICGGESGPYARPMHPDWARLLRDQCAAAGVPFFFKQHGEWEEVATEWRDDDGNHHQVNVPSRESDDWFVDGDKRNCLIAPDGTAYYYKDQIPPDVKCRLMDRVGKKKAGRLLDGREHSEYPQSTERTR